jgi:hypothetical protein
MPEHADRVLAAAIDWWRFKGPVGWSENEHLLNPIVNTTTDAEKALALAIAALIDGSEKAK